MGERYIKVENGKEVIYEKSDYLFCLDSKVGDVKDTSFGRSEVKDRWGFGVIGKIERENLYGERKAVIAGEIGTFTKGRMGDGHMSGATKIFRPEPKEAESTSLPSGCSKYSPSYDD